MDVRLRVVEAGPRAQPEYSPPHTRSPFPVRGPHQAQLGGLSLTPDAPTSGLRECCELLASALG